MRYQVHRTKDFEGTDWIEIGPGKYDRKHWQPGFLYVWEEDFVCAEIIIGKHWRDYDHFAMNDIPQNIGLAIVNDWRRAATNLQNLDHSVSNILSIDENLYISPLSVDSSSIENSRDQIASMLTELASSCETFIQDAGGFCVLGL